VTRCLVFIPGICYRLDVLGWCDAAREWALQKGIPSDSYEYHEDAWDILKIGQYRRARDLAAKLDALSNPVPISHSNGCGVLCDALRKITRRIEVAHLFGAATWPSFSRNGLNWALQSGALGKVFVHFSPDDAVLWLPALASRVLTLGLRGYGDLGRVGPQHVAASVASRVIPDERWGYGHSDWLGSPLSLDETLSDIVAGLEP
jgi:hypothetical protein